MDYEERLYGIRVTSNGEELGNDFLSEKLRSSAYSIASKLIEEMPPEERTRVKEVRIKYDVSKSSLLGRVFGGRSEEIKINISLIR